MAARVFKLDELATRISAHLHAISPISTVALALTCRALEVPALRALWEKQGSFIDLITRVLPEGTLRLVFLEEDDIYLLVSVPPSLAQWASCILTDNGKPNRR